MSDSPRPRRAWKALLRAEKELTTARQLLEVEDRTPVRLPRYSAALTSIREALDSALSARRCILNAYPVRRRP